MSPQSLFLGHRSLRITSYRITPQGLELAAEPVTEYACCPLCGHRCTRVHSHHRRLVRDLPACGRPVMLVLHLRRFFCDSSGCPRRTFVERIPEVARCHARKSHRLTAALQDIAFTAGGEAGSRLAVGLGMPCSGDTLLRLMRTIESPQADDAPRVLGVDDWALRRGQMYGTILCNLETHQPIDLLPERSGKMLADWLRLHPGVEIITRDRSSEYAKGAADGAPQAVQVADRWHLLHNLTDALKRDVDRRSALLEVVARESASVSAESEPAEATEPPAEPSPQLSRSNQQKQQSRQRRLRRYQRVRELMHQGMSLRQIAHTLKLGRCTVRRYASCEQFPERATPAPHRTPLGCFIPFLKQQWEQGNDNVARLWKQLKTQGFTGSIYMVRRQVRQWRTAAGCTSKTGPRPLAAVRIVRPSARRIAGLALGHVRNRTDQDQRVLMAICRRWPEFPETVALCKEFADLLKRRDVESLQAWRELAEEPGILPEVRRFAQSLRQDWAAVIEAVRLPWSQGQVEGQINRLKLIKRQMYGRAGFDLLRRRVLHRRRA
jgi:transposase